MLFAIVAAKGLSIHNMDTTTIFLNGELDEIVYMEYPKGYNNSEHSDYVLLLFETLYGVKQACALGIKLS